MIFWLLQIKKEGKFQLQNKMNLIEKRGQIGVTITWFAAFLIIFFIMLLFVGFSSALAGKKAVLGWLGLGGFNEIKEVSGQGFGDLESQRKLFYLLNSLIDENKNLKNSIVEWYLSKDEKIKEEIEGNAETILNSMSNEEDCYIFAVNDGSHTAFGGGDYILVKKDKTGLIIRNDPDVQEHTSGLNIFLNNQKINTILYFGEC